MNGWMGNILRINLTTGKTGLEDLDPEAARMFIGGHGLGAKILMDEVDPKIDPLSAENKLIFSTGPLTGTAAPASSRYMVIAKSPLTGLLGFANSGGFFGPAIKTAGYDHIIIEGKADKPVYIWIDDDTVEIRDADHIWGKDTHETEDIIRGEVEGTGKRARVACIGPAGEKLVKIAAIMNDKHRAAARCGLGAVMGSKNLKGMAVRGSKKPSIADPDRFKKINKSSREKIKANPVTNEIWPAMGTASGVMMFKELGVIPSKNFQDSYNKDYGPISGEVLSEKFLKKPKACFSCPLRCGRGTEVTEPGFEGEGEGPEYETVGMFGPNLEINSLAAVTKANYICNELGIDTISFGGTLGCAFELYEKGYLTKEDTGIELTFGDGHLLVKLAEMTGKREGFGDMLAEGGYRIAEKYGHPELFMGVHKMEIPSYDPRAVKGMGITYMTSSIGPSHGRGYTVALEVYGSPEMLDPVAEKGKAAVAIEKQNQSCAWDATGLCIFVSMGIEDNDALALLSAATGETFDELGFIKAGERIFNLQRLFNLKAGIKKEDEILPERLLKEPLPDGMNAGSTLSLEEELKAYYKLRGWDGDYVPTKEKLEELGLSDYI